MFIVLAISKSASILTRRLATLWSGAAEDVKFVVDFNNLTAGLVAEGPERPAAGVVSDGERYSKSRRLVQLVAFRPHETQDGARRGAW